MCLLSLDKSVPGNRHKAETLPARARHSGRYNFHSSFLSVFAMLSIPERATGNTTTEKTCIAF
jgi:hypothetical protein